ncbi:MAG: B12-binding domain-containing radical SAM protein [Nitrospirae bacterium]|nr:B12-binding domain-containing radical SAM protein [Nitrospirota bacterium]
MRKLTLVNISKGFESGIIPLGLTSISAYLKKHGNFNDITLLDSNCQDIYQSLKRTDIVGISAVTQDIKNATLFAGHVKSHYDIPVILGGVHISTYRKLPAPFDLGVIGEGEETMLELMQLPDYSKSTLKNVKGICFNENGETFFTEPRELISDLDSIPMPDRDIANLDYYLKPRQIIPYHVGRSLTMISSRGCPFTCVFCSTKVHWKRFRGFSAKRVLEEIELLIGKYQAEIIHIFDDLFIADKQRLAEIHHEILKRGINKKVKFMCLVRADMLDDPTMTMLKDMNVVVTGIGMESGCEKILSYLKRRTTTIDKNRYAIELSHKYGIPTMGSFMLGNPGETEQDLLQTLDFIRSYRYSPYLSPLSYIATAFPGTDFWDYGKKKGINVEDIDKIVMDIPNDIHKLDGAPLLTDIPKERFFSIIQKFAKEGRYSSVKHHIFLSRGIVSIGKAYANGIVIEKNPFRGIIEVTKIIINFIKLKYAARNSR